MAEDSGSLVERDAIHALRSEDDHGEPLLVDRYHYANYRAFQLVKITNRVPSCLLGILKNMDASLNSLGSGSGRHSRLRGSSVGSPLPAAAGNRRTTSGQYHNSSSEAAAAANSLQLLLREDPLLREYGMTELKSSSPDQVAFPYAAALLEGKEPLGGLSSAKHRADASLQDVERKLALVESLAVKLSRTKPEAVAGHLLRLHGYHELEENDKGQDDGNQPHDGAMRSESISGTTLAAIRDRADRLERQSDVLDGVAKRVETSLTRCLTRMENSSQRLERVLTLSSTLKSILRLQFESNKLVNYDLEDSRDLTRAAASVAVVEELLALPEFQPKAGIRVVNEMRPQIERTAKLLREAAAKLLEDQFSRPNALPQLGSTLQVYFHLGELPVAVWKAIDQAHAKAETVSRELFNAVTLVNMTDQAKRTAKEARLVQKKLKQIRTDAAHDWAASLTQVVIQVRNMQRVLSRKTDPVSRQVYLDVVAAAPIPPEYAAFSSSVQNRGNESSIFALFWGRVCSSLSNILREVVEQDQGKYSSDVAALYPSVRAASVGLVGRLNETTLGVVYEDTGSTLTAGTLGGSSILDDEFLQSAAGTTMGSNEASDNPQAAADSWTRSSDVDVALNGAESSSQNSRSAQSSIPFAAVFQSQEWKTLQSNASSCSGLYPLQQAFLKACSERLCAPLQYMFPDNVTLDDNGVTIASGLSLLPSKYDVQRFDENIRQELSLADPREGGGDLTAVTMIAECVVSMISQFCDRARNALSGVGEDGYLKADWMMSESLQHDRKVVAIMYAMAQYLRAAPEKTFVAPYRPAASAQHEEAASVCQTALVPALQSIDKVVTVVLNPLCRTINRRIASVLSKMHHGVYIDNGGSMEAFVQKYLADIFDLTSKNHLSRFPPEYAAKLAATISSFSIYSFVSNAFLIRPLGENARLHITQDLADLELSLEQLVSKNGGGDCLSQVAGGKPYAELRAVRQMLFWSGLEDQKATAGEIYKALLREPWINEVRPSTILHYLISFGPNLLSSPHHLKHTRAEEYASLLARLDGSGEDGEESAWMTVMACCDSYQQRTSSSTAGTQDGDSRIPNVLMLLGQELLQRRRH